MKNISLMLSALLMTFVIGCQTKSNVMKKDEVVSNLQEKLIMAKDGDVIELPEGTFQFTKPLSIDKLNNITLKGQGKDKTIISFKGQTEGAEGLKISACHHLTLEGFSMFDTKGDIIKAQECKDLSISSVKVGWTNGPDSSNGSYALYPVTCENVLIQDCEVFGASDAGIYVGQSKNIIVRNNYVHENVAGIEIENSMNAEVYKNKAENNTGGICIFDLPNIPIKYGMNIRVFDNEIINNNHVNFAPLGNTVAMVPAGTGSFILSSDKVEFFNNKISNHHTVGTALVSYLLLGTPITDSLYDPFYNGISIHDNVYTNGAKKPDISKPMGGLMAQMFGANIPEIIIDGIYNPANVDMKTGQLAGDKAISIKNNGNAQVVNLDAGQQFKKLQIDAKQFESANIIVRTDPSWYKEKLNK
jgi:parallel beta-helix repeat protein